MPTYMYSDLPGSTGTGYATLPWPNFKPIGEQRGKESEPADAKEVIVKEVFQYIASPIIGCNSCI